MTSVTLIDNYDSFTFNLVHYLGELGATVKVLRNDAASAEAIAGQEPDAIVLSPGPCTPHEAGVCLDLIRVASPRIPIFGVCLGHQAIGEAFGGEVVRAPQPVHGKIAEIFHDGETVFHGLPSPFKATRYHSLVVRRESLPTELAATAHTGDGLIMGLSHITRPTHGVQFHPESIASEHGHALMRNFLDLSKAWNAARRGK
ncbi:anthranilate synthase component II [Rhodoblastus sp.]|uniref:anthranilate synthase component II n=1 Tax=Rhodoblastus sp. TaxID=1962975 RepID=UPI003F9BA753